MTFYTRSKIQDLAKSMLEVQARIDNVLRNIFWSNKNQETLKQNLEVQQDSKYSQATFLLSRKIQDPKFVQDGSININ